MARFLTFFVLNIFGLAFARHHVKEKFSPEPFYVQGREVTQNLLIDIAYDAGKWGIIELCVNGSYAFAVEIQYNPPDNLDETAINGVKLYCKTVAGHETGYITSSVGTHGQSYGMQICNEDLLTGFRANVLEYQGAFTDDVAVQDFEVDCNYGMEIVDALPIPVPEKAETRNFKAGTWSSYATCREGTAVCGIQTRYEDGSLGDETAISDVVLFCCDRPVSTASPLDLL